MLDAVMALREGDRGAHLARFWLRVVDYITLGP